MSDFDFERMMQQVREKIQNRPATNHHPSPGAPLCVPGFGLPVEDKPLSVRTLSSVAFQYCSGTPLTFRERKMIAVMGEITDKPDWQSKIKDESIVKKWRAELKQRESDIEKDLGREIVDEDNLTCYQFVQFTDKMFDFCLEELAVYASQLAKDGFLPAIDATAAAYKSDTVIPDELRTSLREAVKPLEDVPDSEKDWHPGSDGLVLDLVHPSLYPLLYSRTRIVPDERISLDKTLEFMGKGVVVPGQDGEKDEVKRFTADEGSKKSTRFQWLPCDVDFTNAGQAVIGSYINNLHPTDHRALYKEIEKVIDLAIPLWDATLTSLLRPEDDRSFLSPVRMQDGQKLGRFHLPQNLMSKRSPDSDPDDEPDENERDTDEWWERKQARDDEWWRGQVLEELASLEPVPYELYQESRRLHERDKPYDLRRDFAKDGLQVIVKLANIHLSPEKPEYAGGSWHVEGQLNERIVASALYYYDSSNITDSSIAFRETVQEETLTSIPDQDDEWWVTGLFGAARGKKAVQDLGRVKTPQGRLLTFPNSFQHQVQPFSLADRSMNGHRKILAMFLVDPHCHIPSTANVPPQQKSWIEPEILKTDRIGSLPPELHEDILDRVEGLIDRQEAEAIREELIKERSRLHEGVKFQEYNFCEH